MTFPIANRATEAIAHSRVSADDFLKTLNASSFPHDKAFYEQSIADVRAQLSTLERLVATPGSPEVAQTLEAFSTTAANINLKLITESGDNVTVGNEGRNMAISIERHAMQGQLNGIVVSTQSLDSLFQLAAREDGKTPQVRIP